MGTLESLRQEITELDHQLLQLLAQRQRIVSTIAVYKKAHSQPIIDLNQEQKQYNRYQQWAEELHFSTDWALQLFKLIITMSRETQQAIIQHL